ncbi:MAG: glycosyltransferase [Gemmatimonadetes bacterium]|nr:glycosyltransferase [Gemmatimonadota bacterium]
MIAPRAHRVLFVTHAYPRHPGDVAGVFLHRLARALRMRRHEVRVVAPASPGFPAEDHLDGVSIVRYRYATEARETLAYTGTMAEQALGSLSGFTSLIGLIRAGARAVRCEADEWSPSVIHAHWWFPAALQVRLARVRIPTVATLHGSDVRLAHKNPVARWLARRALTGVRTTTVSDWLGAASPVPPVDIAPMPLDDETFRVTDEAGERMPGRVVFAGRLNAQKGILPLIEAMSSQSPTTSLEVFGEGPLRAEADARVSGLGLTTRVRFHGNVSPARLAEAFRAAHVVAIPSVEEGLGLVAAEAILCGAPVVGFCSGGLPDVVEPAAGTLVTPASVDALAGALRDRLSVAPTTVDATSRARLADRLSPASVAARYERLYDAAVRDG